jgi:hypothetical protein
MSPPSFSARRVARSDLLRFASPQLLTCQKLNTKYGAQILAIYR